MTDFEAHYAKRRPRKVPDVHGPPPPADPVPRMNPMAVLAVICAVVVAPAGIVLGVLARRQIRRTGEQGGGLALAAIVLGAVVTVLVVAYLVLVVVIINAGIDDLFEDLPDQQ